MNREESALHVQEWLDTVPAAAVFALSLLHISEPTRLRRNSYAGCFFKKKKNCTAM